MQNYYLCYKSELSSTTDESEIINILGASQKNNLRKNITGMLLYINNHFIQLIEGEREDVNGLYKKIVTDSRHFGARILSEGVADKRFFPNWIMGFRAMNPQDLKEMAEMNGLTELSIDGILNESNPHFAIELLKSFYKNGELDFYKFWKEEV